MKHPEKMRQRRETVEHPFGTIKARMGATHFLMKTLPRVASEMALHVLAYNLTRVMNHRHSATHHSDEGIVSIRKINAPHQLRRPCVASPWAFLHNQDPLRHFAGLQNLVAVGGIADIGRRWRPEGSVAGPTADMKARSAALQTETIRAHSALARSPKLKSHAAPPRDCLDQNQTMYGMGLVFEDRLERPIPASVL
jgi:Transposase DDE domain